MSVDAPASIAVLRQLAPKLNAALDEASQIVHTVEKILAEQCKLSLPLYKSIHPQKSSEAMNDGLARLEKSIGYDRIGGRFRIVLKVVGSAEGSQSKGEIQAWSDASRPDKLESFRFLPLLLDELAALAESHIRSTNQSIEAITQALAAISQEPARRALADSEVPGGVSMAQSSDEGNKSNPDYAGTSEAFDDSDEPAAPLELAIPDLETLEDVP